MGLTLDIFNSNAFSMREMTDAINIVPNRYGLVNSLGIFADQGVAVRDIWVEQQNGVLNLLPAQVPGSPAPSNKGAKRVGRSFRIPHIPLDEDILAAEVAGVRAFGTDATLQTVSGRLAQKLAEVRAKHEQTREWMMVSAIKGILVDGSNATQYNYFTEFNVTQGTTDFALGTAGTDMSGKCMAVKRAIEQGLQGESMTGIVILCGDTWYDRFVSHANVKGAFQYYSVNNQNLAGDYRKGFTFAGLTFINYTGTVTLADGSTTAPLIPLTEAYAVPLGTRNTFKIYNAPADFAETVNTLGLPYYSKQERMPFDRGIIVHTEQNPLPICLRPGVLHKLTTSN